VIYPSPAAAQAAMRAAQARKPAPAVPAREWNPADEPTNPTLDRAFPLDQCVPIPVNAVYLSTGGHSYSPTDDGSTARHGWYVPRSDGSADLLR
jgi:hypothetical protein